MTAARYFLVSANTQRANAVGLEAGNVVAVPVRGGTPYVLRVDGCAPPLGVRARLEAEGVLVPLGPPPTPKAA